MRRGGKAGGRSRNGPPSVSPIMIRTLPLAALLATAACVSAPPRPDLARPAPVFDAARFFTGRTDGTGDLRIVMSGRHAVHVQGTGHMEGDTLVLDQRVERDGAKPQQREWRLRATAPGHYTGTLTDARGPVSADAAGNTLHIRYHGKGGPVAVEQWIYLAADGQSALNRMTIRMGGVPIAALTETIRRGP